MFDRWDEITKEIYRKYKPALKYIGVDFADEDVLLALEYCDRDMESAFQAIISYWKYKEEKEEDFYANPTFIKAVNNRWQPKGWQDEYLEDPRFKSLCIIWWEEAGLKWGQDTRNKLVADVNETDMGEEYILLPNGTKISLAIAKIRGWDWVLSYVREQYENNEQ